MYKSFGILKHNQQTYINTNYSCHISSTYIEKFSAENAFVNFNNNIFCIVAQDTDIRKLYCNISEDIILPEGNNINKITVWLWYINYYLKTNNIDYKIVTNRQIYFNFMENNNV